MSIHAITGVMGSGKSYEAVSEKIVVALRDQAGRRVVTNIEGLNKEAIAKYIKKSLDYVETHLIVVDYERVAKPLFWYDPEHTTESTIVGPGDLVVLDEVWRYFNRGVKLPEDAMRFFRMHRHYVGENGITCDVVLINQALRGIHKDITDVVELQFACRKLKVFGRPQNYQVFLHEGGERKASHQYLRTYKPAIFALYSSYKTDRATESIDRRQNVLSTPFFKYVIPGFLVLGAFSFYYVYNHFKNLGGTPAPSAASAAVSSQGPAPAPAPSPASISTASSSEWRVVATYQSGGLPVVLLTNKDGHYRTLTAAQYSRGASDDIAVFVPAADATKATPFTGPPSYRALK